MGLYTKDMSVHTGPYVEGMYILNAYNYPYAYVAAVMKYCAKACPGSATREEEEEGEEMQAKPAH